MESATRVVAIVDDDDAVRRALRRLVTSLSFQAITFASGEEFLADTRKSEANCVLLDLHMPGLGGLDVLLQLKAQGGEIPAIVITGFDQQGMREKCLHAGASDYLVKPLDRTSVASALEATLAA